MAREPTASEKLKAMKDKARKDNAIRPKTVQVDQFEGGFVDVLEKGKFIRRSKEWFDALPIDQRVKLRCRRSHELGNVFQLSGRSGSGRTRVFRSL